MDNIYIFLYHNDYIRHDINLPINIINHSKKYSDLDFDISLSNYYYLNSKLEKLFNSSIKYLFFILTIILQTIEKITILFN